MLRIFSRQFNGLKATFKYWRLLAVLLLLGGCAATPQTDLLSADPPEQLRAPVALHRVPFFPQQRYQCGPAALATVLVDSGVAVTPTQLVPLVYTPGRKGSLQLELIAASRSFDRLPYQLRPELQALLTEIRAGRPVLVMQNLGLDWYPQWHFAVVKGFDLNKQELLLNSADRENYALKIKTFERTWARAGHWAMVVTAADQLPATAEPLAYFKSLLALQRVALDKTVATAYQTALHRWPQDKHLLMGYGNWLYEQRDLPNAAKQFSLAVAAHPEFAQARNNFAQVLFELGDIAAARAQAEQAVAIGGSHAAIYQATLMEILRKSQADQK